MATPQEMSSDFFFIIGRGRSGTDLLKSILNTHPGISVPPEALFILFLYRRYRNKSWTSNTWQAVFDDLWYERRLTDWWQIDPKNLYQYLQQQEITSFQGFCRQVYRYYAIQQGKAEAPLIGDKNPTYTLFIGTLMEIFPQAKFIFITRDYRDNILSFQKVSFDLNNTSALAQRWKKYNANILLYHRQSPQRTHLLQFESLLTHPEHTLQHLCEFLEVDYHPQLLQFYTRQKELDEWQQELQNPLNPEKAARWKQEMPERQVRKADYICSSIGEPLGYFPQKDVRNSGLFLITLAGRVVGGMANIMEIFLFRLPTSWKAAILNYYRQKTDTLTSKEEPTEA